MMNWRFSSQQRVRLVVGELAVGHPVGRRPGRAPRRSSSGPTIGPAMPLPPSTTTFSGLTAVGSMNDSACALEVVVDVDRLDRAAAGRRRGSPASIAARTSPIPASPESASAPSRTSLTPGVGLRVVRGGDHRAAVELARADQVIEHLGADHARRRGRARPRRPGPSRSAARHLRRRRAACRGRARPAARAGCLPRRPAEHAGEGAADRVGGRLVHLARRRGRGRRRP